MLALREKHALRKFSLEDREELQTKLKENLLIHNLSIREIPFRSDGQSMWPSEVVHIDSRDEIPSEDDGNLYRMHSFDQGSNESEVEKIKVNVLVICIEDAAKPGMDGVIRPLLMGDAPSAIFACDTVNCIVLYKWQKFYRKKFQRNAILYAIFLIVVVAYVSVVATSNEMHFTREERKVVATILLGICFPFGVRLLVEKTRQLRTQIKDGKHFSNHWTAGFRYFFSSRWNWMDTVLWFIIVIIIPIFHGLTMYYDACSACEVVLSVTLSLLILLAFFKIFYYVKAFRVGGSMVQTLLEIIANSLSIAVFGMLAIFGTTVALHLLYRGIHRAPDDDAKTSDGSIQSNGTCGDSDASLENNFGTWADTVATLSRALFGDFDIWIFFKDTKPVGFPMFVIFVVFLISELVIFINPFAKMLEKTLTSSDVERRGAYVRMQATSIDEFEAGMSDLQLQKISAKIGKYLNVLGVYSGAASTTAAENQQETAHDRYKHIEAKDETSVSPKGAVESVMNVAMEKRLMEMERRFDQMEEMNRKTLHHLELLQSFLQGREQAVAESLPPPADSSS